MHELVRYKKHLYCFTAPPPLPLLQTLASLLLFFEVKCNYPLFGMKASSDPGVEVSQLDVDQAHQPQGGLCRFLPLCATEYSCPHQHPRVVSVYPGMLIPQHCRDRARQNGGLSDVEMSSLKCLHLRRRIRGTEHLMWHGWSA